MIHRSWCLGNKHKRSSLGKRCATLVGLVVYASLGVTSLAEVQNDEGGRHGQAISSDSTAHGASALILQKRIVVQTNSPTLEPGGSSKSEAKSFSLKFSWRGWDGIGLDLSQKTPFKNPLFTIRQQLEGTNVSQMLHLEEVKMSGKIGAKMAVDAAGYIADDEFDELDAAAELRRARIYAKGDCLLVLPVSYEIEVGYVPDRFYLESSYLRLNDISWIGELKGGQFQPPMALEMITSSRDLSLMEAAAPIQALAPGSSAGMQIGRPVFDHRATWRFGLFTDGVASDVGDATQDYGRAIMRFTGLPYEHSDNETENLLHLGLSGNILYSASSSVRYRSRPESHLAPYVVDTGDMSAKGAVTFGAEAAWVNGPFSLQAEYILSFVDMDNQVSATGTNNGLADFGGFYVSASWFITGESRPYDRVEACLGRVIPRHNFEFDRGGRGAWEVAVRMSYVDVEDHAVNGGRLAMLMGGINWYLHSHAKWRFDYGVGHVADRDPGGSLHIFQTRIEIDF